MSRFLSLGLGASLLAHGAAYAALAGAPKVGAPRSSPSSVEFEVAAPKPAPPPPPTTPPPPPPPVEREQRPAPKAAAPAAPPPAPEPKPAAVDLSGLTLTNDSGEGWSSPSGNGSARQGPLGPVGSSGKASHTPEPVLRPQPVALAPQGPTLVASADLSDKPRPPTLDAALRQHYPPEARMRAISGTASLRVRIDADGRVRSASLLSETFAGFGNACRRALIGSQWSPPRDKAGRTVATEVRYTCRFVVD